ncbi:FKBP-type peptidyl-prolyl cis-trans isomerase, partial [Streptococcus pneumoniae]
MKEGGKYELYVPSQMAYGEHGMYNAGIGPNSVLVFVIDLKKVSDEKAIAAEQQAIIDAQMQAIQESQGQR